LVPGALIDIGDQRCLAQFTKQILDEIFWHTLVTKHVPQECQEIFVHHDGHPFGFGGDQNYNRGKFEQ
jgi:hypothetical protein